MRSASDIELDGRHLVEDAVVAPAAPIVEGAQSAILYLTPPTVSPATRYRCTARASKMIGKVMSTAGAVRPP